MTRRAAQVGLAVSGTAFVLWLGWLGYLVLTDARPPVVSYPQLLAATADVVATVSTGPDGQLPRTVTVKEVLRGEAPGLAAGQTITIVNLPEAVGYAAPGDYLIPLVPEGPAFRVPRPARSPGSEYPLDKPPPQALIYPWTEAVQREYHDHRGW